MIHRAKPTDLGNLLDLLEKQFREHQIPFDAEEQISALGQLLDREDLGLVLLVEEEDQTIGFGVISFAWTLEHGGKSAWLDELYVQPEYRNEGLGSMIVAQALQEAKRSGCRALDLEVNAGNSRAERLYERHGFKRIERTRWMKEL
jgi:ribosomal protein S18 acetylase RimI-like enzyme